MAHAPLAPAIPKKRLWVFSYLVKWKRVTHIEEGVCRALYSPQVPLQRAEKKSERGAGHEQTNGGNERHESRLRGIDEWSFERRQTTERRDETMESNHHPCHRVAFREKWSEWGNKSRDVPRERELKYKRKGEKTKKRLMLRMKRALFRVAGRMFQEEIGRMKKRRRYAWESEVEGTEEFIRWRKVYKRSKKR